MSDPLMDEWNKLAKKAREHPAPPPPTGVLQPQPRRRRGAWALPALFFLSLAAVGLYLQGMLNPWPAPASPDEIATGKKASLLLTEKAIRDEKIFSGKYPQELKQVMPLAVEIDYRQVAGGFELLMKGRNDKPLEASLPQAPGP